MLPHVTPNASAAQQSTIEEWRAVPGYEGRYEVSSFGRVRSLAYNGKPRHSAIHIKPQRSTVGYLHYTLFKHGAGQRFLAHRLVMAVFVGESTLEVNHKDGDKLNNRLGNLEYVTHSDNMAHAARELGKWKHIYRPEPTERDRQMWAMVDAGMTHKAIAEHFGVKQPRVSFIVNQKRQRYEESRRTETW